MANKLPSIKPDIQLIIECNTLLPKLGNLNTGHRLEGMLSAYYTVCYLGNPEQVIECEKELRMRIFKARLELAETNLRSP